MPLVVSLMVATSLLYMVQPSVHQRGWVLFGGVSLSLAIMMVVTEIYWSGVGGFSTSRIVLVLAVFLGVMFMPALIGLYRHFYQRGSPRPA
jgi:Na+/H+ antiporter NhaD/arsenite permease-like protein